MIPTIHDDKDGIVLQFDFGNGLLFGISLDDEAAQQMIDIIQNKINERIA